MWLETQCKLLLKDVDYMESGPSSRRQNIYHTALLLGQSNMKIKYNRTSVRIHR